MEVGRSRFGLEAVRHTRQHWLMRSSADSCFGGRREIKG